MIALVDVYSLLALCLESMPRAWPKPRLVIHESAEAMAEALGYTRAEFQQQNGYPSAQVVAMADPARNLIHLPYTRLDADRHELLDDLLHEIGHLRHAQQYGADSAEFASEPRANAFAARWMRKLRGKVDP